MNTGELSAKNEREAYLVLQNQGLVAVEIKEIKKSIIGRIAEKIEYFNIDDKWTALFFRRLSTTLDIMTLNDALSLFAQSTKEKTQQKIIHSMINDIKRGRTLAEAMESYSSIFSKNIVQMIVIAQHSGRMQEITGKLAEQLEKNYKAKKKIRSALYYPTFVLIVAMIAISILISIVLPTFTNFFASQEMDLPILTKIFLTIGLFFANNLSMILFLITIVILMCLWIYKNSPEVQLLYDKSLLKLPFFGKLIAQREWMNSFGSLSFLLESGVQIDQAIEMIANATSNKHLKNLWLEIKYKVERGEHLQSTEIPTEYQGLITTGEASGTLPEMLKRCEMLSEFEVDEMSNQIPVKVEVFSTLFIGIIVALIAFSVILPVLSINI